MTLQILVYENMDRDDEKIQQAKMIYDKFVVNENIHPDNVS